MVERMTNMPYLSGTARMMGKKIALQFEGDVLAAKDEAEIKARSGCVVVDGELAHHGIVGFFGELADGDLMLVNDLLAVLAELGYKVKKVLLIGSL